MRVTIASSAVPRKRLDAGTLLIAATLQAACAGGPASPAQMMRVQMPEADAGPEFAGFVQAEGSPGWRGGPGRRAIAADVRPWSAGTFGPVVASGREQAALAAAASGNWPEVMSALRAGGLRLAAQDARQATLLSLASQAGAEEVIAELLRQGADVHQRGHLGWPPLAWAVMEGRVAAVRQLVRAGADLSSANGAPQPPLHWAAQLNRVAVVHELLVLGVPMLQRNARGETAAQRASAAGATEVRDELLARMRAEAAEIAGRPGAVTRSLP